MDLPFFRLNFVVVFFSYKNVKNREIDLQVERCRCGVEDAMQLLQLFGPIMLAPQEWIIKSEMEDTTEDVHGDAQ